MTSENNNFKFNVNNFDLIRLLAAVQVAFIHGNRHLGVDLPLWLVKIIAMFPGVPIFFVTSGFLISASLERNKNLRSYFLNRFLRIFPALWVCFAVSLVFVSLIYSINVPLKEFFLWVLAQLTFVQFFNPDFMRGFGVGVLNGALWTITVELQFYIVLPFVYYIFEKLKWHRLAIYAMFIVFLAINVFYKYLLGPEEVSNAVKLLGVTVFPYLYMFMLGVFLQRNILYVKRLLKNHVLVIFLLYIVSIIISWALGLQYTGTNINAMSAFFLGLLTLSVAYTNTNYFSKILRGFDISYGFYIYHMVIINVLLHLSIFRPGVSMIIMFILTATISIISWRYIEKPALGFKRYTIKSK